MADPFAHGTPVGDTHMWADPGQGDCPNCPCCVVRLCREAAELGVACVDHPRRARSADYMSVAGCPCTAVAAAAVRDARDRVDQAAVHQGAAPVPEEG